MSLIRILLFAALSLLPCLLLAEAASGEGPVALPPLERFHALVERPLFRPDRKPPAPPSVVPEGEEAAAVDPTAALPFRFVGTLVDRRGAVALVELEGERELVRLMVGDRIGAWQVTGITADRLVLSDGRQERQWSLHE